MSSSANHDYEPRGSAVELFYRQDPEIIVSGPAGTGKSRACLEKLHLTLLHCDRARGLVCRKTLASLTSTGLVTFREKVRPDIDGVEFFGGSPQEPPQFRYLNGSRLVVGGLDNPQKILSGEYDIIYVQQAEEATEHDWETLTTRLRNGVVPFQQLIGDCNPDAPTHWLKQRADRGDAAMLESRHEENPHLFDGDDWTREGRRYIAVLDALTGVRKARLRDGRWVKAEGVVYEGFDRVIHLIDRFEIPRFWRRIRAVDFGFTNPFVCQWWAIDGDDRMYLYREIYRTQTLVSAHADTINALSAGEWIEATVADHDAEDRATLHSKGIPTLPAYKAVTVGIQAVQDRLTAQRDGKARLFVLRDSLVGRDEELERNKKPVCAEQEFDSYSWPKKADGKPVKEEPMKIDDHGMDALRYAVAYVDRLSGQSNMRMNRTAVSGPRPITVYEVR